MSINRLLYSADTRHNGTYLTVDKNKIYHSRGFSNIFLYNLYSIIWTESGSNFATSPLAEGYHFPALHQPAYPAARSAAALDPPASRKAFHSPESRKRRCKS